MSRKRRAFNPEHKAEVVKLVWEGGPTIGQVSRELDLTESAVRNWVRQAEIDQDRGPDEALTTAEREELHRLNSLGQKRENIQTGEVDLGKIPE